MAPLRKLLCRTLSGFCLLGSSISALGAPTWETKDLSLKAKFGDKEAVGLFHFKNPGGSPLVIDDIRTACECLVAETAKRTYAPGEGGAIKAILTLGNRVGLQDRTITVTTGGELVSVTTLTLHVNVPEPLVYSTRLLRWPLGGSRDEKSLEISATGDNRLASLEISKIAPQQADARAEVTEPGQKYRLIIRPDRLDRPWTIAIYCVAGFEDGAKHSFVVYALAR